MLNRDVYQVDPSTRKLVNEGVANLNNDRSAHALEVLRYELDTFVCDGQYEKGLTHILETYLKNLQGASAQQQPAVWVSGFYGSGKSHLIKMLRALWENTEFSDGATARGIADLPQSVAALLKELSTEAKRHGGLHAVGGTLGSSSRDKTVRMALLGLFFRSVGLPEQYHIARLVMWMRKEGIYDAVQQHVAKNGGDWDEEISDPNVAEKLYAALCEIRPRIFSSEKTVTEILPYMYPIVNDVSNDEMITAIRSCVTQNDQFPLTLVVLDEVQQYIGDDTQRSIDVQEVVETCCKNIGVKLMFIGTGQTAITGFSSLKKLEGRFTVRIELSDEDVDTVIRKVILAKKPSAVDAIQKIMETNSGEIARHLAGTTVAHNHNDTSVFPHDYPILPVRRRFWEHTLRVLDRTGTDSQLRNQLSTVHKVVQTNLDQEIGHVVPADFLYFDSADKLLQARVLPRKVHDLTLQWYAGTPDQKLTARACGLVFLIAKLNGDNAELGIKATVDTLADLLVEDLSAGSATLRSRLPALLDTCELINKVGEEYRIQTEESTRWHDKFMSFQGQLKSEPHRLEADRAERIRERLHGITKKIAVQQGNSKVPRSFTPVFDASLPSDAGERIYLWVRDGWSIDENSVLADARQAGITSHTVFVHIPKRNSDALRTALIEYKAAVSTIESQGPPTNMAGEEAKAAIETIKYTAEANINQFVQEILAELKILLGGGAEVTQIDLQTSLSDALQTAAQRLYTQFAVADHTGWAKVYQKAAAGDASAMDAIGDSGEAAKNPVCKAILSFVGAGKKGADIRKHFDAPPYGWSGDAIDGALQVLLMANVLRAEDEHNKVISPSSLERKALGKVQFLVETPGITAKERIEIRRLLADIGIKGVTAGEESAEVPLFLQKMDELAAHAGGDAPRPDPLDTAFLQPVRATRGNAQLAAILSLADQIKAFAQEGNARSQAIQQRTRGWSQLTVLLEAAKDLPEADLLRPQVQAIIDGRQLLHDPDPVQGIVTNLTQILRDELNDLKQQWDAAWTTGEARLEKDANWQQLEPEVRHALRAPQGLVEAAAPKIAVDTTDAVLETVRQHTLASLKDRIAAMPTRYDTVLLGAAQKMAPTAKAVSLPGRTLTTEQDVDQWLAEVRQKLMQAIKDGPAVVS